MWEEKRTMKTNIMLVQLIQMQSFTRYMAKLSNYQVSELPRRINNVFAQSQGIKAQGTAM